LRDKNRRGGRSRAWAKKAASDFFRYRAGLKTRGVRTGAGGRIELRSLFPRGSGQDGRAEASLFPSRAKKTDENIERFKMRIRPRNLREKKKRKKASTVIHKSENQCLKIQTREKNYFRIQTRLATGQKGDQHLKRSTSDSPRDRMGALGGVSLTANNL